MKVEAIHGEALRYHVESQSKPNTHYLVDLSEHFGNGLCHCPNFTVVAADAIKKGNELYGQETSCKHVRAAWTHFRIYQLREIARLIKEQEKDPNEY